MTIDLHEPVISTDGLWAEHDQACAVCQVKKAVLNLETGIFEPCWGCQSLGYLTHNPPKWYRRFLRSR